MLLVFQGLLHLTIVHLSKDGEVVVAHDNTLERMCGPEYLGKHVSDYNFLELPRF